MRKQRIWVRLNIGCIFFFLSAHRSVSRCGSFRLNSGDLCLSGIVSNELAKKLVGHGCTACCQLSWHVRAIAINANDFRAKRPCDCPTHRRWIFFERSCMKLTKVILTNSSLWQFSGDSVCMELHLQTRHAQNKKSRWLSRWCPK